MSDGIKSSEYALLEHRRQIGHVAEWLRRGLQRPYVNRVFPYEQYNKVRLQVQDQSVAYS